MDGFLLNISSYTASSNESFINSDAYIRVFKGLSRYGLGHKQYYELKGYTDNPLVQGFELSIQYCEDKSKKIYILQARFNTIDDLLLAKLSVGQ